MKRFPAWFTHGPGKARSYTCLELVDFHCDVVGGALVSQKEVLQAHPALAVLHLPPNLLQLHQQPRFLLVIFSVGFNYLIMVHVLAGTNMGDLGCGNWKQKVETTKIRTLGVRRLDLKN